MDVYRRAAKRAPTRPRPRAGLTTEFAPEAGVVVVPAPAEAVPEAVEAPVPVAEPVPEDFGAEVVMVVLEPTTDEKPAGATEATEAAGATGEPAGEVTTAGWVVTGVGWLVMTDGWDVTTDGMPVMTPWELVWVM